LSKGYNLTAQTEADNIQNQARNEIDWLLDQYGNSPYPYVREVATTRASNIQRDADEMTRLAKARASQREFEHKQWSTQRGELLDQAVSNLENQMVTKGLPDSPRLVGTGTNLFVRNYFLGPSSAVPPHAALAHVNDRTPQDPIGEKSLPEKLPDADLHTTREVKGKLLSGDPQKVLEKRSSF
jgi:hypothetical protein